MMIVIALTILVIALIVGIPVAFAFFATSIFLIFTLNYDPSFLIPYGFGQMSSTLLLSIPLFILAGNLIEKGGAGQSIIKLVEVFIGKSKSGLGVVTVVSCGIFGAISGNASATITTIGTIMLPRLKQAGYPAGFSASLIASSSVLGILIPPSSLMIVYAWLSNSSVLAAFLATIIPGFILIITLSIINIWYIRKYGIDAEESLAANNEPTSVPEKESFGKALYSATPVIILAIVILGGIYGGFMTPTEAAAVSVVYSVFMGVFLYRKLNIKIILRVFLNAAKMTGIIMLMFYGSIILNRMLIMENLPDSLTGLIFLISEHKIAVLIMINIILIIIGMLMDDTSGVLLSTPILLPIAIQIGVDPIHYASILAVNMGLGVVTPPAAPLLYLGGKMANAKINEIIKPTLIMILFAWLPTLIITTYYPDVALFLPRLFLDY